MRYLFYSHDGFGLGHTRRHLAIARALTDLDAEASILLACGSEEIYQFQLPPQVEVLKLPALRKVRNGHYVARRLKISPQEAHALRSELLTTAIRVFRPGVVLVDKHPFGVCGEFRAGLETARRMSARIVLGLRDILDEPAVVSREWQDLRDETTALFDAVMIYGDRDVYDAVTEYQFAPALAARTHYCGYVLNERDASPPSCLRLNGDERPLVIATTGGGEDGFALLDNFLRAAAGASWRALVVAGPMTPEPQFLALKELAEKSGALLQRFVANLPSLFPHAAALVCMGGYNTLVEAASAGIPTICVPRVTPRREQAMRAAAFSRLGLLCALPSETLCPDSLRSAVDEALQRNGQNGLVSGRHVLHFDGATRAAERLHDLNQPREKASSLRASLVM